jgi:hypothetical protein
LPAAAAAAVAAAEGRATAARATTTSTGLNSASEAALAAAPAAKVRAPSAASGLSQGTLRKAEKHTSGDAKLRTHTHKRTHLRHVSSAQHAPVLCGRERLAHRLYRRHVRRF